MSSDKNHRGYTETVRVRGQADAVLSRLLTERDRSERRLAEAGRRDPMKVITGRSAIDNAIAATREMIERMDGSLGEFGGQLNGSRAPSPGFGSPKARVVR